jgi:hypothetical protein
MQVKAIPYYGNGKILPSPYQQIYEQIYSGYAAHKTSITIPGKYNSYDLFKIAEFVMEDHPRLFYIGNEKNFTQSENSNTLKATYLYNPSEADKIQTQIDRKVSALLHTAFHTNADALDKITSVYTFLVQKVKYCDKANANQHDHTNHSMVGPLLNGKSVCEGYARAFKFLCDAISIPCVVVRGPAISPFGGEELHAWNIVKLKGGFYHVDATWDSCQGDIENFDYFCISDEDASKDRSWDRSIMPVCSTTLFPVSYVKGKREFEQFILANVSKRTMSFPVRFDNQFLNISEKTITNIVISLLKNKTDLAFRARGLAVEVRWNETQRKAVIKIR